MSPLSGRSGSFRRSLGLAVALAALGQVATPAAADPVLPKGSVFKPDLTWKTSLAPVPSVAAEAPEPAPLLRFDDAPNQLFPQESLSPGLQFSLDPDNEEVFLGWQIEF